MSVNENSSDEENKDITKQSSDTHNLNQLFPIKINVRARNPIRDDVTRVTVLSGVT